MSLRGTKLGAVMVLRGLLSPAQLAQALALQGKNRARLGDILLAEGMVDVFALHQSVAAQHGLPFRNLLREPPPVSLLSATDAEKYLRLRLLPVSKDMEGAITVALASPDESSLQWARARYGEDCRFVITSPYDIRRVVETYFAENLSEESRFLLWRMAPLQSARQTLTLPQQLGVILLCFALIAAFFAAPAAALRVTIAICQALFACTLLFKVIVFTAGRRQQQARVDAKAQALALDEATLPVYTVLVPMVREASSLPGLIESLQRLDYPRARLDIKLVLESDDRETLAAAMALRPAYHFDILRVPPSQPRTKPKALNYALRFARGEYVTIYDADDRPDPLQLKKAVAAFRTLPPEVMCLQARLNYYNARENILTRLFALEYGVLFDIMLPGLQRLGLPIPLGGTSNHFALARLRSLGEWDPFNVTEDADLGVRLAAARGRTAMLDSITWEEAPLTLGPWLRQRSRWIKGYLQTWLVHMRRPFALYRSLGFAGFFGFQFFVGFSSFTYLVAPLLWLLSFGTLSDSVIRLLNLPAWCYTLSFANLIAGFLILWWFALSWWRDHGKFLRKYVLMDAVALFPYYWLLHSLASYKAVWQLVFRPHFWEKTTHGLTRLRRPAAVEPLSY